jgi:ankyrin repeat protein
MTLLSAAKQGDTAHVQSFLQSGAAGFGVNSHAGGGWTPLMIAAANGRVEVVELLLSHAADVTLRNADGETALSLARRHGYGEVERLLEAGGAKE